MDVIIAILIMIALITLLIWRVEERRLQSVKESVAMMSRYESLQSILAAYPEEMHDEVRNAWKELYG